MATLGHIEFNIRDGSFSWNDIDLKIVSFEESIDGRVYHVSNQ